MQHWKGRGKIYKNEMAQYPGVRYHKMESTIDIEDTDFTSSGKSTYRGNCDKLCWCWCYYAKIYACLMVGCIDWFVSGVFWLMLRLYRAIAGRPPLFLKNYDRQVEEVKRLQNENHLLKQQANSDFGTPHDTDIDQEETPESQLQYALNFERQRNNALKKENENHVLKQQQANSDLESMHVTIKTQQDTFSKLQSTLKFERQRINALMKENDSLSLRVQDLIKERNALEDEKQDALRRLSEQVSVKLRDNNPNIVDLNDQCRPTKLAEMFSELYDNEWTNAFTDLEGCLGEEHAIVALLDIVMGAYGFCEERVTVPWNVLKDWFLDRNIPGAQQASKWLKDSRKANIKNKVPEVGKEYARIILATCKGTELAKVLSEKDVTCYLTKCIELCLLMVTTDPPVVLKCPGWRGYANSRGNDGNVQQLSQDNTLSTESKRDKDLFDRDLFKEYTTRGKYLDYIVWPALFLYEDGPLLSKGIAQGSAEQCRDTELMMWTWCGENIII